MKTLHFNSMLHAHKGEPVNPHRRLSSSWYAWEAINRAKQHGHNVIDAWRGRGMAVMIRTPDSVTAARVL